MGGGDNVGVAVSTGGCVGLAGGVNVFTSVGNASNVALGVCVSVARTVLMEGGGVRVEMTVEVDDEMGRRVAGNI